MICQTRTSFTGNPAPTVAVKVEITMVITSPDTTTDTATVSPVKHGFPLRVEQLMYPFTVVDE
jgi:hypothetical protein